MPRFFAGLAIVFAVCAVVVGVALLNAKPDHPPHRGGHLKLVRAHPDQGVDIRRAVYDREVSRLLVIAYVTPTTTTTSSTTPAKVREQQPATTSEYAPPEYVSDSPCGYADLIRSVWAQDAEWAIGIAYRESRCQAGASNSEGASGLFQLMMPMHADLLASVGCSESQWSDPSCNVRAAWALYQGSGRGPWAL